MRITLTGVFVGDQDEGSEVLHGDPRLCEEA